MPKIPANLTGAAGEHFVAYRLSCLGHVAALPRGGALGVDVLVSTTGGDHTLAIQLKTTDWAVRSRGRGEARTPFQLQFPLGRKAATTNNPSLLFAFVDLRDLDDFTEQPDVYLVPSPYVYDHCKAWVERVKMVRFHVAIQEMDSFKNNWGIVSSRLGS